MRSTIIVIFFVISLDEKFLLKRGILVIIEVDRRFTVTKGLHYSTCRRKLISKNGPCKFLEAKGCDSDQ